MEHHIRRKLDTHVVIKCTKRNAIIDNRIHWCMDVLGGKINVVLAYLLHCSLSDTE